MMCRLTPSRSTDFSIQLPLSLHCALIFLIFAFITPMSHSKTPRGSDLDLSLEHHRSVVEELKSNVLQHMSLTSPPSGYNVNQNKTRGKLIRDFYRRKLNSTNHSHISENGEFYLNDLQTFVFQSTDPEFIIQVQPQDSTSSYSLTTVKFSTNFQQPDVPYHDLLIKSAILRLRINRQRRKLRRKAKFPLNVTIYLMSQGDHSGVSADHTTATFLRSVTINTFKRKNVEIAISSHLLSHIVDSDDKTVTIGIRAEVSAPSKTQVEDKLEPDLKRPRKKSASASEPPERELIRVFRASLHVTSQTLDLRRARTKRQDDESSPCSTNLCCKHSIEVKFEDIGWSDWVLYPISYVAHYCKGDCPERFKIASSFTNIKTILHERYPDVIPAPVCAPTGYSPIVLEIFDGDAIRTVSYPGMLVTGCRCH